jgi:hypothetical protein
MTDRERILATIRGETPDCIPWVPRLYFWYRARRCPASLAMTHPHARLFLDAGSASLLSQPS